MQPRNITNDALGEVRVSDAKFGNWSIETFLVNEYESKLSKIRSIANRCPFMEVDQGEYKRLMRIGSSANDRVVVMSNTRMEVESNLIALTKAQGNVLIAGVGLGMILHAMLKKSEIKHITVVEIDTELMNYIKGFFKDERITFINEDIFKFNPKPDDFWDYVWLDIWDDIYDGNLKEMRVLKNRFKNYSGDIDCWSVDLINIYKESKMQYLDGCDEDA
jgi:hypothetical protein